MKKQVGKNSKNKEAKHNFMKKRSSVISYHLFLRQGLTMT